MYFKIPSFQVGMPIKNPDDFIGRDRILGELSRSLLHHQSISIKAERRLGATSLLLQLVHPNFTARFSIPETHLTIYLDFQSFPTYANVNDIFRTIFRKLASKANDKLISEHDILNRINELLDDDTSNYYNIRNFLFDLTDRGYHLHLLFDEFEQITSMPNLDLNFLSMLRSLTISCNISFIVATRVSLSFLELGYYNNQSSPFFNFFSRITLPLFKEEEVVTLIHRYFNKAELEPSLAEKLVSQTSLLHDITGHHPFFLQMFLYHLCNKLDYLDWPVGSAQDEAMVEFERNATDHFEYFWQISSETERELLKKIATGEQIVNEREVNSLQDRGLIISDKTSNSGYKIFSSVFCDWCLRQGTQISNKLDVSPLKIQDIKRLIFDHSRALQKLKEQQAKFGPLNTPPHILLEIDEREEAINKLQMELEIIGRH